MASPVEPELVSSSSSGKRLAVIGEAPGLEEEQSGHPFTGRSGRLLRSALKSIGVTSPEWSVLFTNACLCRPPGNRTPTDWELDCCRPYLTRVLNTFRPTHILVCGASALRTLTCKSRKVLEEHGSVFKNEEFDAWTVVTIHPAMVLYKPAMFTVFAGDVEKLTWDFPPPTVEPVIRVAESPEHALQMLETVRGRVAYDVETTGLGIRDELLTVGISPARNLSLIIPAEHLKKSEELRNRLSKILTGPEVIGHNSIQFDDWVMRRNMVQANTTIDTMLLNYALDPGLMTNSLKGLGHYYLGIADWSIGPEKIRSTALDDSKPDELYTYQGTDTAVTYAVADILLKRLEEAPHTAKLLKDHLYPAARMLADVSRAGILVERNRLYDVERYLDDRAEVLQNNVRKTVGIPNLNLKSHKQVSDLLFHRMGMRCVRGDSTAAEVLNILAAETGVQILRDIAEYRSLTTMKTNTLKRIWKAVDPIDSRVRTSFLLHGTATGRLASTDPNMQNIPARGVIGKRIRNCFVAPPGKKLLSVDYSQLELRVAAWFSQDPVMLKLFRDGADVHTAVASIIFGKPEQLVTKEERAVAKVADFGLIYGQTPEGLVYAMEQKISFRDAEAFQERIRNEWSVLSEWTRKTADKALKDGYVETPFGRRRYFNYIPDNRAGIEEIRRQAVNTPIQSMASDICLRSGYLLHKKLDPGLARLILLIHDELLFEVDENRVDEALAVILPVMERDELGGGIRFICEYGVGRSWGNLK